MTAPAASQAVLASFHIFFTIATGRCALRFAQYNVSHTTSSSTPMTTRRQFIEGAVAAGTAAAAVPAVATALGLDATRGSNLRLERVVFDERFADARAFAEVARRRSVETSAINDSVHELWYRDLYYRWRDEKAPIAGITDHRALFLLEMMAGDAGMRVVHRVHHHESRGTYAHRVFGPLARRADILAQLSTARSDWAQRAADIVTSWPISPTPTAFAHSDILTATAQALDARTLISWVIR